MVDKKMQVIGIQGVNASGKSSLSHLLARDYIEYDVVATDNLLAVARMHDPFDERIKYSSYSSWEQFGEPISQNIARGFNLYRGAIRPYIECMLQRARDQKVGMIIEGIHIEPEIFKEYAKDLNVSLFLLHMPDEVLHLDRIRQKCSYRPGLMERFVQYFPRIRDIQKLLLEEQGYHLIDTSYPIKECLKSMKKMLK